MPCRLAARTTSPGRTARKSSGVVARLQYQASSAVTPLMLQTESHPDGIDRAVFDAMVTQLKADRPHFLASFGKTFFGAGMLNFTVTNEILTWAENTAMLASPKATID